MAKTFKLEIVTPERNVLTLDVASVVAPGVEGYIGILADHAPLISELTLGKVTVKDESGSETLLAISGGFMEVRGNVVRILADSAVLGLPEITLGLFPGAGGTQRLIRQVPLCRAKELMFTGDRIDAGRAVALGLANMVVPREKLMDETMALAGRIAEKSPLVLKLLKRTLNTGADMALSAALAHEQAMIGLVLDTDDAHEGCQAFLEKRKPVFKGV